MAIAAQRRRSRKDWDGLLLRVDVATEVREHAGKDRRRT
jgi:hypothetical protein